MSSRHPNCLKSRFARRFLRALMNINSQRRLSPPHASISFQRYQKVKMAADRSLAFAVGSRRPWSRAILSKIRNQARTRHASHRRRRINHGSAALKRRHGGGGGGGAGHAEEEDVDVDSVGEAEELRRLVPGGEAMNLCSLLEEAAHYVVCLRTQVQVMASVAHHFYST